MKKCCFFFGESSLVKNHPSFNRNFPFLFQVFIQSVILTEAEDIKKRWQEYTEELYKKDLHDPGNHNGVITHLEPDILDGKSSGP